jgi:FKBP-type peptidyl-prolyl cis-trans isomerase SlyD
MIEFYQGVRMRISKNAVVTIEYHLTDPQGQVIDSSRGREPLSYVHGVGGIIPGLESALEGKDVGDEVSVDIAPEQAYGIKDPGLVQAVPRSAFRGVDNIQPGMQFQAQGPGGQARVVTVVSATPTEVTVDANHPLAGITLHFDVKVIAVREATAEELSHGHAHGPGGHHH